MISRCAVCGTENEVVPEPQAQPLEPPDLDTRPGEPLRSTLQDWVQCCSVCGYCADDLSTGHSKAAEIVETEAYRNTLADPSLPVKARQFLGYAYLLDRVREHADAGWSALHGAWVCDDLHDSQAASRCREQAIEYWKRGKHAGQGFSEDLASEYALVADLHRRMAQFELALVTCSEALDMDDLPPVIEHVLRRQKTLVEQKDTAAHSLRELIASTPV
jgi:hypothetical protein